MLKASKKKKTMLGMFQAIEMCILGTCDKDKTPDKKRLDRMMQAGLGKIKIEFPNKNANHLYHVKKYIAFFLCI
jgi:hypothetical protein